MTTGELLRWLMSQRMQRGPEFLSWPVMIVDDTPEIDYAFTVDGEPSIELSIVQLRLGAMLP